MPRAKPGFVRSVGIAVIWLLSMAAVDQPIPDNPLVDIPGGRFIFGNDAGLPNEAPARAVELLEFRINKFEITNAEYAGFTAETGRRPSFYWNHPELGLLDHPVVGVTFDDAAAFCAHYGLRLPTEEQWERAARGTQGWFHPWGNDAVTPERANRGADVCCEPSVADGYALTAPVGRFEKGANAEGVQDLIGNVWEWVDAWYNPYETPESALEKQYRVLRGGAWNSDDVHLTATYRMAYRPDFAFAANGGFRCVQVDAPAQ
jgi:iron(II)-dependent oxidoreductase